MGTECAAITGALQSCADKREEDGAMTAGKSIISMIAGRQDLEQFRKKSWVGTFEEYLDLVRDNPKVARNAFERVYEMVISYGTHVYEESRGVKRTHFKFFDDPDNGGRDAVFGL